MREIQKLRFSKGKNNKKLVKLEKKTGQIVYSFSLLSGHTCPYANECNSQVIEIKNEGSPSYKQIKDGPNTIFRCFSASEELIFGECYKQRKHNMELLRGLSSKEITDLIQDSLPQKAQIIRIHVAGDFYNQTYFDGWLATAQNNSNLIFYAYTKSIPFWINRLGDIPPNLRLTASLGGLKDGLVDKHKLVYSKVVHSKYEASKLNLPIDNDDSHALNATNSFALMVHGQGPPNSKQSKIFYQINKKAK